MPIPEPLRDYATELGFPDSEILARIFEILFKDDDEIRLVAALPGTAGELAKRTGLPEKRVTEIATQLLMAGSIVVEFSDFRVFRRFPSMIFLRDSSPSRRTLRTETLPSSSFRLRSRTRSWRRSVFKGGIGTVIAIAIVN